MWMQGRGHCWSGSITIHKGATLTKTQLRVMEIKMCEWNVATKRRCIIMDKITLLENIICIFQNVEWFMWIQMKQNYDKHVERMDNWKDISEEKDWASKARLVPFF